MTSSLAAVFHGSQRPLELQRFELPQPTGEEILVRVLGCTLCGSDLHTVSGRRETPLPTILGHEIVGEILEFGDAATKLDWGGRELSPADPVTWAIVANCGKCFYCARDLPQKCLSAVKYGHESLSPGRELRGGLAEHCLLAPGTAILKLPNDLPLSVACPASCATATVAAAITVAGQLKNCNVCLFGAGLLGITAAAMARVAGAASIVCVDVDENRLRRSLDFGVTHITLPGELERHVGAISDNLGFDVVLELSGSNSAVNQGLQVVRRGGKLILVGSVSPSRAIQLEPEQIVRRNLNIHGIHNYAPHHLLQGVNFLVEHHHEYPFADLVTDWFELEAVNEAFEASRDSERIRVGVRPG